MISSFVTIEILFFQNLRILVNASKHFTFKKHFKKVFSWSVFPETKNSTLFSSFLIFNNLISCYLLSLICSDLVSQKHTTRWHVATHRGQIALFSNLHLYTSYAAPNISLCNIGASKKNSVNQYT